MSSKFVFEMVLCTVYAGLNVAGAGTIKAALTGRVLNSVMDYVSFLFYWKTILGLSFVFLSSLVVFKALSISKFTYILPVSTGINFILVFLLGIFVFQEQHSWTSYVGAALVLAGIFMLGMNRA